MPAEPLRGVLFDLDGTLHDRDATIQQYLRGHARRFPLPAGYAERFVELDDFGYASKELVFPQLVEEFGLPHDPGEMYRDFLDFAFREPVPMKPAREVLAELRTAGLQLGLVTNGSGDKQRECLAGLGLDHAFDAVLVSEKVGCRKPDASIYALALERLGPQAAQVIFVGDSPLNDVAGPQRAGMRAAWLPAGHPLPAGVVPDWTLGSLRDLSGLLT